VKPVKILALLSGAYFGSLLVAAVLLVLTAAFTSGSGAGRTGNAMLMMLSVDALFFLATILGVFLALKKAVDNPAVRILITAGYGIGLAITGVLLAIFSAVFFNR
jgi:ABC-type transport system involved in multi-copper enzyme maturation permease subunit